MYDVQIFFTDYCFGFLRYVPRTHAHKVQTHDIRKRSCETGVCYKNNKYSYSIKYSRDCECVGHRQTI